MIFHNFNMKTGNLFVVTPTEGVPIDHLKKIVDHYYKFKGKSKKDVFSSEPLAPIVPVPVSKVCET